MNTTQTALKIASTVRFVRARQTLELGGVQFVMVYTRRSEELYRVERSGLEMFVRYATDVDLAIFEAAAKNVACAR